MSKVRDIQRSVCHAPPQLCCYGNVQMSMAFFQNIEKQVFINERYVELDFSQTVHITAAAALYLVSVVTKCQNCAPKNIMYPHIVVSYKFPPDDIKWRLFDSTGILEIIKPGGKKKLDQVWEDLSNPFQTGNDPAKQFPRMLDWYRSLDIGPVPQKLHSAVQEGYLNIKQHAYDKHMTVDFLKYRWWLYAVHDSTLNRVAFLLLDRGLGIPRHVNLPEGAKSNDVGRIAIAMQKGWSSTGEPGRGRGTENIRKPINLKDNDDRLMVMSGMGKYNYIKGSDPRLEPLPVNFQGTLIEWSLSLD